MRITDLTWPSPGAPATIARWYQGGSRGLIVSRSQRTVYDWDMDNVGETLPVYIAAVYVPRKLAGSPGFREASNVTLYRLTGADTMEELVSVPFFSPPVEVKEAARFLMRPAAEVADAMITNLRKLTGYRY